MDSNQQVQVLVTGSAGCIGRAVVTGLTQAGITVRGFDQIPTPGIECIVGNLIDRSALEKAAEGTKTLIHLAAFPDDGDFLSDLVPNNIIGLHNVLEAARLAGVTRIILASTGQVVWWQILEGPWPVEDDVAYSPRDWYAVTKVAAEAAGQAYARNCGMAVVAVRLGWFPRTPEHAAELAGTDRGPNLYFSPGDAARFFQRTVQASIQPGFYPVYAASRPIDKLMFDLEPARRLLGWEPLDQWPTGAEHLLAGRAGS